MWDPTSLTLYISGNEKKSWGEGAFDANVNRREKGFPLELRFLWIRSRKSKRYRIIMNVERSVNSQKMSPVEWIVVLTPKNGMLKYACR